MIKSSLTLVTLFLLASLCTANLKPTSLNLEQALQLNPAQTLNLIVQEQAELYQKVLRDYLNTLVQQTSTSQEINRIFFSAISSEQIWNNLKNFMIQTLFVKFEMNTLSDSFGSQIKQFPDNYFLTFEMYDLLHD